MKYLIVAIMIASFIVSPVQAKKKAVKEETVVDVTTLKKTVDAHGKSIAGVQNQVNEAISGFQTTNGNVTRNFKKIKDQDRVSRDMQTRLQVLEDTVGLLTGQLQELQTEGLLTPKSSKRFTEFKKYSVGLQYMNSKEYDKAVKEFLKFRKENPKSIYNSYAQFWIGEAYYMQSDYPMAIKQYQKLFSVNSKSSKASTALYRQGLSFYNLQSFDDAKAFFAKVIRSHPKTIEAIQASSQIKRIDNIMLLRKQQELEMKMVQ
jgi:tol-pal system protein YbgF